MVELFEHEKGEMIRRSSKGNQLKWNSGEYWYKDDIYPEQIKQRVYAILLQQRRKYQWMFQ